MQPGDRVTRAGEIGTVLTVGQTWCQVRTDEDGTRVQWPLAECTVTRQLDPMATGRVQPLFFMPPVNRKLKARLEELEPEQRDAIVRAIAEVATPEQLRLLCRYAKGDA